MTIKNLVESSRLKSLERSARDEYLGRIYGITPDDFSYIRADNNGDGVIERVMRAGEKLHYRLLGRVDSSDIPAQFTGDTLAALIDDGKYSGNDFGQLRRVVSVALRRKYGHLKVRALSEEHLDIPYTQFLREDLGVYQGNLRDAKKRWPRIQVSNYDWLKEVFVPLAVGELEAALLGVYFARGNLFLNKERIEIWGEDTDFDFYRKDLRNLIKTVHNFVPEVISGKDKGVIQKDWSYDIPAIVFNSLAICTWLHNEWGLPDKRNNVEVPVALLENSVQQKGFFKGILAADGKPYVYPDRSRLRISKDDEVYIESVKSLSEKLGFTPRIQKRKDENSWVLDYAESEMVDMIRMGLFMNSHHQKVVGPLRASIVESPRDPRLRFSREELRCMAFLHNCHVSAHEIGAYFGFNPLSVSQFLSDAKNEGFKIMERRADNHQFLKDVLNLYDKRIPPRKPNQP